MRPSGLSLRGLRGSGTQVLQIPNLKDQVTVLYTPSYGPVDNEIDIGGESLDSLANMDMDKLFADDSLDPFAQSEPVLFVTGPDIVRNSNRVGLTLTSMAGVATTWYLSIYPFLLNDNIKCII